MPKSAVSLGGGRCAALAPPAPIPSAARPSVPAPTERKVLRLSVERSGAIGTSLSVGGTTARRQCVCPARSSASRPMEVPLVSHCPDARVRCCSTVRRVRRWRKGRRAGNGRTSVGRRSRRPSRGEAQSATRTCDLPRTRAPSWVTVRSIRTVWVSRSIDPTVPTTSICVSPRAGTGTGREKRVW